MSSNGKHSGLLKGLYPEAALEALADHIKSNGVDAGVHGSHVYPYVVQHQEETAQG